MTQPITREDLAAALQRTAHEGVLLGVRAVLEMLQHPKVQVAVAAAETPEQLLAFIIDLVEKYEVGVKMEAGL